MNENKKCEMNEPCTESKLLALHTAIVCLARTLAETGKLDRKEFKHQLDGGRKWLESHDHPPGHNVQVFDEISQMLRDV